MILPDTNAPAAADPSDPQPLAPVAEPAFDVFAAAQASSADAPVMSAFSLMAQAVPTGVVVASDAFISVADPLPVDAAGGLTLTASQAIFVADPALLQGAQVATQRFLVMPVEAMGQGSEDQTLADLTVTESALPPVITPVGVLPGGIVVTPDVDSPLVFAGPATGGGAFGQGQGRLTLTLSVPVGAGVLSASEAPAAVTIAGSGTSSLTLSGSEAALSAYLGQPAAQVFYKCAAAQALTLTASREAAGRVGVLSTQSTIGLYGASRSVSAAPVIVSLPARLWVTAHTDSLLQFPAAVLQGAGVLQLTLSLPDPLTLAPGEGLRAQPQPGDGVTVLPDSSARVLRLSGGAGELATFLATAGRLHYAGPAGTASGSSVTTPVRMQLTLASSAGQSSLPIELVAPAQPAAASSGLRVLAPASLSATPGAQVPLVFAADALAG